MPRVKSFCQQEVLEKAMQLFWKQGFYATSIQDLVKHLGINRASLYDTYGGKQELFEQALQLYKEQGLEQVQRKLQKSGSIRASLKSLFEDAVHNAVHDQDRKGCFVSNCATELIPGEGAVSDSLCAHKEVLEHLYKAQIEKGQELGEITADKDAAVWASYLFTLQNGIQISAKLGQGEEQLLQSVAIALSSLFADKVDS
jgi:TetR/AcrR family transcriptional repressor of nem operon